MHVDHRDRAPAHKVEPRLAVVGGPHLGDAAEADLGAEDAHGEARQVRDRRRAALVGVERLLHARRLGRGPRGAHRVGGARDRLLRAGGAVAVGGAGLAVGAGRAEEAREGLAGGLGDGAGDGGRVGRARRRDLGRRLAVAVGGADVRGGAVLPRLVIKACFCKENSGVMLPATAPKRRGGAAGAPGMALQFLSSSLLHATPSVFLGQGMGRHGVGSPSLSMSDLSPSVSGPLPKRHPSAAADAAAEGLRAPSRNTRAPVGDCHGGVSVGHEAGAEDGVRACPYSRFRCGRLASNRRRGMRRPAVRVRTAQYSEELCRPSFLTATLSSMYSSELPKQGVSAARETGAPAKGRPSPVVRRRAQAVAPGRVDDEPALQLPPEVVARRVRHQLHNSKASEEAAVPPKADTGARLAEIVEVLQVHVRREGVADDGHVLALEVRGGRQAGQGPVDGQPPSRGGEQLRRPLLRARDQQLLAPRVGPAARRRGPREVSEHSSAGSGTAAGSTCSRP